MQLALLFSGGKDSSLVALLLRDFYDVTLYTAHFGVTDDWKHAKKTADNLNLPFKRLELDEDVIYNAAETAISDGYPRNAIQFLHTTALEQLAEQDVDAIADGTRRDDRVPTISRAQAQSLEDRHDVDYVTPLQGFGRNAVDRLVDSQLDVVTGPSEEIPRADYEAELRAAIAESSGMEAIPEVFPDHEQTYVKGRR
ncbi:MAG: asparagine synthase-related protein [Halobacteriaceae archaeon]